MPVNKEDTEKPLYQCSLISTLGVPLLESLFKFTTYTTFNTSDQHLRHSLTGKFIQIYNINNFYILDSLQVYAAWADWFKQDLVTNHEDIFSHDLIHSDSMTSN